MIAREKLAWHFRTELPWREDVKARLDSISPRPWLMWDSDRLQDSITQKITEHAWLKIFEMNKGSFVANLTVEADRADFAQQLEQAKRRVFDEILPALGAYDVSESEPIER
jgi:hypothetical protein